jgi:hypothetical protein
MYSNKRNQMGERQKVRTLLVIRNNFPHITPEFGSILVLKTYSKPFRSCPFAHCIVEVLLKQYWQCINVVTLYHCECNAVVSCFDVCPNDQTELPSHDQPINCPFGFLRVRLSLFDKPKFDLWPLCSTLSSLVLLQRAIAEKCTAG